MHPVIQQALNLFRQGIISQTQLDKLVQQFTPQNTQVTPPTGEVPTLGAAGTVTPPPGVNMAPPQPGYPLTPPPPQTMGTRG
jgi:hypothetical protein